MSFKKIDMENWNRTNLYTHFMVNNPCTYSMTVDIDVTKMLAGIKLKGLKFFPVFLYALSCVVNKTDQFKMDIDKEGNLGMHEVCNPSFSLLEEGMPHFENKSIGHSEDFETFYNDYINKNYIPDDKNIFNVSCISWAHFTSFNLNIKNDADYLRPIFTMGKYKTSNGISNMPLAIQVHHAVCDGEHISKFVIDLQDFVSTMTF